jgi:hypothetical protein
LLLQTIDWNKSLYLTTDASFTGLGAWIGQEDAQGDIKPVICASKKLTPTQQRWSATKRELYALMWAMQKLRHYLLGRQFIARVDHRPLVEMLRNRISPMMEGWIDTILQFQFVTQYVPGHTNDLADALSRSFDSVIKSVNIIDENDDTSQPKHAEFEFEAYRRGKSIPDEENRVLLLEQQHALGHFGLNTVVKNL